MPEVVCALLIDIREFLDDQLKGEVDNYTSRTSHPDYAVRRAAVDEGDCGDILWLEKLIDRIDEALADNRGAGI